MENQVNQLVLTNLNRHIVRVIRVVMSMANWISFRCRIWISQHIFKSVDCFPVGVVGEVKVPFLIEWSVFFRWCQLFPNWLKIEQEILLLLSHTVEKRLFYGNILIKADLCSLRIHFTTELTVLIILFMPSWCVAKDNTGNGCVMKMGLFGTLSTWLNVYDMHNMTTRIEWVVLVHI